MADSNVIIMTDIQLELEPNNLYRNGRLIVFPNEGEMALIRDLYETSGSLEDDYHTVVEGDDLDEIAWEYYEEQVEDPSKYWWVIADANNIYDPFNWVEDRLGQPLLVPNIINTLLALTATV